MYEPHHVGWHSFGFDQVCIHGEGAHRSRDRSDTSRERKEEDESDAV